VLEADPLSDVEKPRGKHGVYFNQVETFHGDQVQFVPRSILVDMEPGVLDSIRGGKLRDLFKPDNLLNGKNIWM